MSFGRASVALLVLVVACAPAPDDTSGSATVESSPNPEAALFIEGARAAGLDFAYFNGMSGEHYFNEVMGGGAALFDYDNDGDLDVYLVQGHMLGPSAHSESLTDRLYRNDLEVGSDGIRRLQFTDVTGESRIESYGYGMGVTAGDYDNDGWIDLYVTNFTSNVLLRNRGDGTFEDTTEASGANDGRWSVAAVFLDFDRDGWLDLYVGNYVDFSLAAHTPCPRPSGALTYCGPGAYRPLPDSLFRNRGDGTFEDVSGSSGIRSEVGTGLGAVAADLDADGWIDLYVANDLMSNQLWINRHDGTFENRALLAGVAVNQDGQPEASMGVDAGDFDGDGDADLVLTHLNQETNTLYVNDGQGLFEDVSTLSGLGLASLKYTGFGTSWFDYDNDGWLDLLVVNGAVVGMDSLIREGDLYPLHQTNQLFRNVGGERFEEVTAEAGSLFSTSEVSRGAAFGDVDNDGDTDVLIVNSNAPVRLLLNQAGTGTPWLGLRIVGAGRDMLGAEVVVRREGAPLLWRRVHADGSYASASDPRVLVGTGAAAVTAVEVRWPDGTVEEWSEVEAGRYQTLVQGEGEQGEGGGPQ
jgi:hypothetical protein